MNFLIKNDVAKNDNNSPTKPNPLFDKFLDKNPFIKTIDLNKRKLLIKNFKIKKNNQDFHTLLSKLDSHFHIKGNTSNNNKNNAQIIEEEKNSSIASPPKDDLSQNNSYFQIPETENIDDLKESEIFDKFYQKIMYGDREIWDKLSLRELEIKKQLASFQTKIFILEKKVTHYKKSNKELAEQNGHYDEQVKNLILEKNKNDKVRT